MSEKDIRNDLREIRYFYSRKELFEKSAAAVGTHAIFEKADKYNAVIRQAPPRLFDVYVSIYWLNNSQESLANKLGYTVEYISMLHTQLVQFFKKNFNQKEAQ